MLEENDGFKATDLSTRSKNYMNLEQLRHDIVNEEQGVSKLQSSNWLEIWDLDY
jgi:hypothetical protein